MRLEYESDEKIKKEVLRIIGTNLDLNRYRVFFFGSRVEGKGNKHSDIDIGIEGPEPVPSTVMSEIKEGIEAIPTLYTIDVVDFAEVSEKFKKVALQHVEYLR